MSPLHRQQGHLVWYWTTSCATTPTSPLWPDLVELLATNPALPHREAAHILVQALGIPRLDYGNSLLAGLPLPHLTCLPVIARIRPLVLAYKRSCPYLPTPSHLVPPSLKTGKPPNSSLFCSAPQWWNEADVRAAESLTSSRMRLQTLRPTC